LFLVLTDYVIGQIQNVWGGAIICFQTKNFAIMKKFFKIYCQGFPGASSLREKLMRAQSVAEVEEVVNEFKNNS